MFYLPRYFRSYPKRSRQCDSVSGIRHIHEFTKRCKLGWIIYYCALYWTIHCLNTMLWVRLRGCGVLLYNVKWSETWSGDEMCETPKRNRMALIRSFIFDFLLNGGWYRRCSLRNICNVGCTIFMFVVYVGSIEFLDSSYLVCLWCWMLYCFVFVASWCGGVSNRCCSVAFVVWWWWCRMETLLFT
jgi:hypothetical protein